MDKPPEIELELQTSPQVQHCQSCPQNCKGNSFQHCSTLNVALLLWEDRINLESLRGSHGSLFQNKYATADRLRTEISAVDLVSCPFLSTDVYQLYRPLPLVKLLDIIVAETEVVIFSSPQNRSYNFAWCHWCAKKGVVPVSRLSSKPVATQTSNAARLAVAAAAVRRDQTKLVHCCTRQTNWTKPN